MITLFKPYSWSSILIHIAILPYYILLTSYQPQKTSFISHASCPIYEWSQIWVHGAVMAAAAKITQILWRPKGHLQLDMFVDVFQFIPAMSCDNTINKVTPRVVNQLLFRQTDEFHLLDSSSNEFVHVTQMTSKIKYKRQCFHKAPIEVLFLSLHTPTFFEPTQ